ncbi:hypothetical protein PR048_024601 [Dryococelus australis]|uniref:Uncharacterized protein n=1 Tax=Dryococelus australis TaxID=614101 RepID=A0ABQ9GNZ8_9NEOP|nr:hypothetical protein PR048_024601 [Dryococelus australis]
MIANLWAILHLDRFLACRDFRRLRQYLLVTADYGSFSGAEPQPAEPDRPHHWGMMLQNICLRGKREIPGGKKNLPTGSIFRRHPHVRTFGSDPAGNLARFGLARCRQKYSTPASCLGHRGEEAIDALVYSEGGRIMTRQCRRGLARCLEAAVVSTTARLCAAAAPELAHLSHPQPAHCGRSPTSHTGPHLQLGARRYSLPHYTIHTAIHHSHLSPRRTAVDIWENMADVSVARWPTKPYVCKPVIHVTRTKSLAAALQPGFPAPLYPITPSIRDRLQRLTTNTRHSGAAKEILQKLGTFTQTRELRDFVPRNLESLTRARRLRTRRDSSSIYENARKKLLQSPRREPSDVRCDNVTNVCIDSKPTIHSYAAGLLCYRLPLSTTCSIKGVFASTLASQPTTSDRDLPQGKVLTRASRGDHAKHTQHAKRIYGHAHLDSVELYCKYKHTDTDTASKPQRKHLEDGGWCAVYRYAWEGGRERRRTEGGGQHPAISPARADSERLTMLTLQGPGEETGVRVSQGHSSALTTPAACNEGFLSSLPEITYPSGWQPSHAAWCDVGMQPRTYSPARSGDCALVTRASVALIAPTLLGRKRRKIMQAGGTLKRKGATGTSTSMGPPLQQLHWLASKGQLTPIELSRGHSCIVARLLARLSLKGTAFESRPVRSRIFARGNRAERRRWSVGFLGDIPFLPPVHSGAALHSPLSLTPISSKFTFLLIFSVFLANYSLSTDNTAFSGDLIVEPIGRFVCIRKQSCSPARHLGVAVGRPVRGSCQHVACPLRPTATRRHSHSGPPTAAEHEVIPDHHNYMGNSFKAPAVAYALSNTNSNRIAIEANNTLTRRKPARARQPTSRPSDQPVASTQRPKEKEWRVGDVEMLGSGEAPNYRQISVTLMFGGCAQGTDFVKSDCPIKKAGGDG